MKKKKKLTLFRALLMFTTFNILEIFIEQIKCNMRDSTGY